MIVFPRNINWLALVHVSRIFKMPILKQTLRRRKHEGHFNTDVSSLLCLQSASRDKSNGR